MKIILIIYICSAVANTCLPPIKYDGIFDDVHTCMLKGYQEGYNWTQRLGQKEVNANKIYVKFRCFEKPNPLESPA